MPDPFDDFMGLIDYECCFWFRPWTDPDWGNPMFWAACRCARGYHTN